MTLSEAQRGGQSEGPKELQPVVPAPQEAEGLIEPRSWSFTVNLLLSREGTARCDRLVLRPTWVGEN